MALEHGTKEWANEKKKNLLNYTINEYDSPLGVYIKWPLSACIGKIFENI